jgi:hypothetical protein
VNKSYWEKRVAEYEDMVRHIKEQRTTAEPEERRKLAQELERLFLEIQIIKDHLQQL